MEEAGGAGERPAFARLQQELATYTVSRRVWGLDVPFWLRLDMEVNGCRRAHHHHRNLADTSSRCRASRWAFARNCKQQLARLGSARVTRSEKSRARR